MNIDQRNTAKVPGRIAGLGAGCLAALLVTATAAADSRDQAKRIHDRLAGVPPTASVLADMAADIQAGNALAAAETALQNPAFSHATL